MSLPTLSSTDPQQEETICCAALTTTQPTTLTGISDSGADISIASYATIEQMDIPISQLDQPIQLTFANGTTSTTQHVANLGPLGSIHLVDDADSTLISINEIVKQGYNVLYTDSAIHILDLFGASVFSQKRKPSQSRWPINIKIAIEQIEHHNLQMETATVPTATVHSVKRHRISQQSVQLVFDLHHFWSHTDSETMALAFTPANPFISTSPFSSLSADIIRTTFAHRPCVACMIGKQNKLPRQLGSGVGPRLGEVWSIDVIGPFPVPTVHGARLYLQAVEVRTGFIKCFLIKENTAFSNILAITDIINLNKSFQHQLRAIRFDAGSVNMSQELTEFLVQNNIQPAAAAPEQQQQNPTERYRQTIQKRIACN